MKNRTFLAAAMSLVIFMSGCASKPAAYDKAADKLSNDTSKQKEYFITLEVNSKAIGKNIIDEPATRNIYVYLPPSYYESSEKYPVVYYLDGLQCNPKAFLEKQASKLDEKFKSGTKEFIMVSLDGDNKIAGSFYANSPISGNWEDYVVKEVVELVDKNYRTKADSKYRGLSGFSMGGFGALYISLRHPDVFGSVLAIAPGVFDEKNADEFFKSWEYETSVKTAYAQVFSPNKNVPEILGNIPKLDGTPEDSKIVDDWLNGYSGWSKKVEDYKKQKAQLNDIMIAYSDTDNYKWIPKGCIALAEVFTKNNIKNTLKDYKGGHSIPFDSTENYFIPFFNNVFSN